MINYSNLSDAEISRLVAEKVMGWPEAYQGISTFPCWEFMPPTSSGRRFVKLWVTSYESKRYDPCNSPDACFGPGGVVGKLTEWGYVIGMNNVLGFWEVNIYTPNGEPGRDNLQAGGASDDSITRAICLAALAAVEKDK